jgi:uncharacterized protein YgiM (DUF1202 family)
MIKWVSILLLFVSILPIHSQANKFYINKTFILKGKPVLEDPSQISPVYPGDLVDVLYLEENLMEPGNDWAKIRIDDGKEGFLPMSYLQKTKPDESIIKNRDIILFEPQKYYVTASSLLLRNGPDQSSDVVSSLYQNTEVLLSRYSDNDDYIDGYAAKWAYVSVDDQIEGWVYSAYLSLQKSNEDQEPEPWDHILEGNTKYVRPPVLRVRDEPGKMGGVIGSITQGQSVKILERKKWTESITGISSIWVKVRADDVEGFVFGGFLSTKSGLFLRSDDIDKPFLYPIDPDRSARTSPYGYRLHPILKIQRLHTGMDIGAATNTPIYAAGDGIVEFQQDQGKGGYGLLTVIKHENGLVTYYAHQHKMAVKKGDRVKAGDVIGYVGSTGLSTGPHLHFEVRPGLNKETFNPGNFMVIPD